MSFTPTDLTRTTTAIFLTRWITHFCAPVFAFTAGIGAFLWLGRNRTKPELSRFLLTRGLWLIFLELTVLRLILFLNIEFDNTLIILSVIWMLGLCMVAMAGLIQLPMRALAAISIAMIAGHTLLDHVRAERFGSAAWVWDIVHQQELFRVHGAIVLVAYPLVPWVAVMAAGYCLGAVFRWEPARRKSFVVKLGLILSLTFILLRAWNIYGDPARWSAQGSRLFTVLSFLNCTKYSPSILFLLMTLGPAMLAMAWLLTGHHPLLLRYGRTRRQLSPRWFAQLKQRRRDWWLSYL